MSEFFGIGVFHSKSHENIGTLFRSAQAFGASFVYTVGRRYTKQPSDTSCTGQTIPIYHYQTLDDLLDHLPIGCRLTGVEIDKRAKPLPQVHHDRWACYLLGAEDHGLNQEAISRCHRLIYIPGAKYCLNVATAGTVVMYDRIIKTGIEFTLPTTNSHKQEYYRGGENATPMQGMHLVGSVSVAHPGEAVVDPLRLGPVPVPTNTRAA